MWNFTKVLSLSVPQLLHLKKKLIIALAGPPSWLSGKEFTCNAGDAGLTRVRKIPWKTKWQPTPVFLPGKSHGQSNLAGYSSEGCKELDMAEVTTHTQ